MKRASQPGPFAQQVYDFLLAIPTGKVATYCQIAAALGRPKAARAVGNILHRNPDPEKYPCYKVVNAKGELARHFAFGGAAGQKLRLACEGIEVKNNTVDLKRFGMR